MAATEGNRLLQFCMTPSETTAFWFLVVCNIVFATTATFGNTVILAALSKESSLHPPSKILLRSLALTDLSVGLLAEPLLIMVLMAREYKSPDFCHHAITISFWTSLPLVSVSLLTLTVISVDRFLALLLGLRYRHVVTFKRVLVTVICSWIMSIGFAMTMFWNYSFTSYCSSTVIILCVVASTCCYTKIYQKLRHHQLQIQQDHRSNGDEPLNIARYRKTVSSSLWVHFTLVICYCPLGVITALVTFSRIAPTLMTAWSFSTTLLYFNSTLNPILYCWKIREVRKAAVDTIKQIFCC